VAGSTESRPERLRRWIAIFALLVIPLLLDPFTLYPTKTSKLLLFQAVVFVLVLLEAFPGIRRRRYPFDVAWAPVIGFGVLFVYHVIADPYLPGAFGSDPLIGPGIHHWLAFKQVLQYGSFFVWMAMVMVGRFGCDFPRRMIRMTLIVSFPIAVYLIFQGFGLDFFQWQGLGDDPRRRMLSTLGNPLYVADFLALTLLFRLWMLFDQGHRLRMLMRWLASSEERFPRGASWCFFSLIALPVELFALFMTSSRGAMAVVTVTGLLFVFPEGIHLARRHRVWAVSIVLVALIFAVFGTQLVFEHFSPARALYYRLQERVFSVLSGDDFSALSRLVLWDVCLRQWRAAPLLGIGMDQFRARFVPELGRYFDENELAANIFSGSPQLMANEAHGEYFQILAEWGIVGLVLLLLLIIVPLHRAWGLARSKRSPLNRGEKRLVWVFFCVIVAFSLEIFYGFEFRLPVQTLLFFSGVGCVHFLWANATERIGIRRATRRPLQLLGAFPAVFIGIGGLLVTGVTYTGEVSGRVGKVCLVTGHAKQALVNLKRSLALCPDRGEFWYYYAVAFRGTSGDSKEALRLTDIGIRMGTDPMAYVIRGHLLLEMGRYQEADRKLSEFARFRVPIEGLHHARGLLHYHREEYEEAVIEFREETKRYENNTLAWVFMGLSYQALKNYPKAAEAFERATAVSPWMFEAHYRHAILLMTWGKYREALEHARTAMKIAEEVSARNSYLDALAIVERILEERLPEEGTQNPGSATPRS